MDIVVVGRHAEIPERFRRHLEDKLSKVEQLAPNAQRIDVEITHERNPRLADKAERVELTVRDRGPVVRAEASASDRYAALDAATARLLERLRRVRDRRKNHHGRHEPAPPGAAAAAPAPEPPAAEELPDRIAAPTEPGVTVESTLGDSPVVIRQKVHATVPMTVDEALYEMELVGHPFYLFIDAETHQPCVVYHRHGWTYGVIRLDAEVQPAVEKA
jgi:ribosomal subunit interface protein